MHTHATETDGHQAGLGEAAKGVAEHASSLARLELELAATELKTKVAALGKGLGLGVGAAVVALYGVGFLLATISAGLGTFLPDWLALLIMTIVLLAIAALLGYLAAKSFARGAPPVPQQAIAEAKATTAALKKGDVDV